MWITVECTGRFTINPDRTASFQIRECFRLASYEIDGDRLYSNGEIAAQLGACPMWVADVLGASFDRGPNLGYDRGPNLMIVDPIGQVTNMTHESANFNPRPAPEGQGS
jgi:hypothetical protein